MTWQHMVQFADTCTDPTVAAEALAFLQTQVDYVAGRTFERDGRHYVQVLFEDCGPENADRLPDGCRRVVVPPGLIRTMQT
jgi:hypothetical protein